MECTAFTLFFLWAISTWLAIDFYTGTVRQEKIIEYLRKDLDRNHKSSVFWQKMFEAYMQEDKEKEDE